MDIVKTRFSFKRGEREFSSNGNGRGPRNGNGRGPRLSDARPGDGGTIAREDGIDIPLRLREMGFVPGTAVQVLRQGPLGDPIEIELRGYRICLRRSDLTRLRVEPAEIPETR